MLTVQYKILGGLALSTTLGLLILGLPRGEANAGDAPISGTYSRSTVVKDRPLGKNLEFRSSMIIKQTSPTSAHVDISIAAPTAGSSCGGNVSGSAIKQGETLLMIADPLDERESTSDRCQLTIRITNGVASVVSEEGRCFAYSGAACDFAEQAIDLKKK